LPVRYQRIMALPRFGDFDLSTFLARVLHQRAVPHEPQADLLALNCDRVHGMTEAAAHPGSAPPASAAHRGPARPPATSDQRRRGAGAAAQPLANWAKVVGSSPGMMTGYHQQPQTRRWNGLTPPASFIHTRGRRR
jgi:hypothetical protein